MAKAPGIAALILKGHPDMPSEDGPGLHDEEGDQAGMMSGKMIADAILRACERHDAASLEHSLKAWFLHMMEEHEHEELAEEEHEEEALE